MPCAQGLDRPALAQKLALKRRQVRRAPGRRRAVVDLAIDPRLPAAACALPLLTGTRGFWPCSDRPPGALLRKCCRRLPIVEPVAGRNGAAADFVKTAVLIVCIILPLFACVAYLTLWERKLIAGCRSGSPQPRGPLGLLQPIATVQAHFKELIIPTGRTSSCRVRADADAHARLAAWASFPSARKRCSPTSTPAPLLPGDHFHGCLWSSSPLARTRSTRFSRMRSAAQSSAYEIAMGFALVVLCRSQSLNLTDIVAARRRYFVHMGLNFFPELAAPIPMSWLLHLGIAETTARLRRGEASPRSSRLHVEYSDDFRAVLLASTPTMILYRARDLISGRWAAPSTRVAQRDSPFACCSPRYSSCVAVPVFRATFPPTALPEYAPGWKVFIPHHRVGGDRAWMQTP